MTSTSSTAWRFPLRGASTIVRGMWRTLTTKKQWPSQAGRSTRQKSRATKWRLMELIRARAASLKHIIESRIGHRSGDIYSPSPPKADIHGCGLTSRRESFVRNHFLAWKHGPVIRPVYDSFQCYGDNKISKPAMEKQIHPHRLSLASRSFRRQRIVVSPSEHSHFCTRALVQIQHQGVLGVQRQDLCGLNQLPEKSAFELGRGSLSGTWNLRARLSRQSKRSKFRSLLT